MDLKKSLGVNFPLLQTSFLDDDHHFPSFSNVHTRLALFESTMGQLCSNVQYEARGELFFEVAGTVS